VQDVLAAKLNDEMPIVLPPATALGVPAITPPPVLKHVPVAPFGVATTTPDGSVSLNAIPCTLVDALGLLTVNVIVLLLLTVIAVGLNAWDKVGDGTALTTIVGEVPVKLFGVSVAVIVWFPGECRFAVKFFVPLTSMELDGNPAKGSLLEKLTVPL
jgi:hypothetical protein